MKKLAILAFFTAFCVFADNREIEINIKNRFKGSTSVLKLNLKENTLSGRIGTKGILKRLDKDEIRELRKQINKVVDRAQRTSIFPEEGEGLNKLVNAFKDDDDKEHNLYKWVIEYEVETKIAEVSGKLLVKDDPDWLEDLKSDLTKVTQK